MKEKQKYRLLPLWFTLMIMLFAMATRAQQNIQPDVLKSRFLKDSLLLEENAFLFNNISLLNSSATALHVQLTIKAPEFLDVITGSVINTEIRPGESKLIPFRLTSRNKSSAVSWYPVLVEMRINETGQVINRSFYVRPRENIKWKATLRQPSVTFTEMDQEIPFEIYLENTGNSKDRYVFSISTDLDLNIPKNNFTVDLAAGSHQTIPIKVMLTPKDIHQVKKQDIEIAIKSASGDRKILRQTIVKMGYSLIGSAPAWYKMPLTAELNLQNVSSDQPFAFFNLRGYVPLKNNAQLGVLFQSDNYYGNFTSRTRLATLQYSKGPWEVTGGSIVDFNQFLIDGTGIKVKYSAPEKRSFEVMALKSRLGNSSLFNFKTALPLSTNLLLSSNSLVKRDVLKKTDSYLNLNKLDWNMGPKTKFSVEAGLGMDQIKRVKLDTLLPGLQTGYHFESLHDQYQLNSIVNYYSRNFPGINKGFFYQLHEARWIQKHFFAGPYIEFNKRSFNEAEDTLVNFLFNLNTREYGVRSGWQNKKVSVVISPGILTQIQDSANSIKVNMYKLSLNANWQLSEKWWLSLFSNAGRISIAGQPAKEMPFTSINNLLNLQSRQYGFTFRYDEGPYYYYEIKQYLENPVKFQRLQVAPFAEWQIAKWNLFYRLQLNYLYEKPNKADFLIASNNLQYSSAKMGLDVGLTTQYNVSNNENPLVNVTIRKRLQMPIYKNNKSKNFKLVLFLDSNNNNRMDAGEIRVAQAKTMAEADLVMSNNQGEIEFRNSDKESYMLDFSQVSGLKGWIPRLGYRQVIHPGKQKTIPVAFTRSKLITGNLVLIRDDKSHIGMPLDGIRMIAVGSRSEVFNTLTNAEGEFFFNLPADNYTITINETVFNENFRPTETSKSADLLNNNLLHVQFEIRQKKRQINIRKD